MQPESPSSLKVFFSATAWLIPALFFVRVFESLEYAVRYGQPDPAWAWLLMATGNDLLFAATVIMVFAVLFFASSWLTGLYVAAGAIKLLGLLTVLASILLSLYFCQARVALGADLFGYSWQDITATVRTSSGLGSRAYFALAILAATIFVSWWAFRKYMPSKITVRAYLIGISLAGLLYALVPISTLSSTLASTSGLADQALIANKLSVFLGSSFQYSHNKLVASTPAKNATPAQEYPLLKPVNQPDVLGPYFNQADAPPNIVVVAVEGLGKSMMPGGRYGGFTPFLESLTSKSLYFPNFLSTTGRSFGFLPGFFASLPPGESGFMSEGFRMPAHDSLISLIKKNGYRSYFFVGFDARFDGGDVFLERQGIDHILGERNFGSRYRPMNPNADGFSWGYADADLFARAQEFLTTTEPSPRLDIYHTVNLHEPFMVPDAAIWQKKFEAVLLQRNIDSATKAEIERSRDIFQALLYTDEALRQMFSRYAERQDYARTIFIITGDHRLIPLPEESAIDRYSVPLIIWSPLLKRAERIEAVSSHADMTPSLIAFLHNNYQLPFPDQAHWLGTGIDMSGTFRNTHSISLMRTKNALNDYLAGEYFLSGGELYRVLPELKLEPVNDSKTKARLEADFSAFKSVNRYVMQHNKIRPDIALPDPQLAAEQALLEKLNLKPDASEQAYATARQLLKEKRYDDARMIARHVLRGSPNYHDIRMLLGRSYAWQGQYDEAIGHYKEVIRRNPTYGDAYSAWADVSFWSDKPGEALKISEQGLAQLPDEPELLLKKAKAEEQLKQFSAARTTVDRLVRLSPQMADAQALKKRLAQH